MPRSLVTGRGRLAHVGRLAAVTATGHNRRIMSHTGDYLLAGQSSELERLQLQSRVWEPAGHALLQRLPRREGARALDVGCGALGWLRLLNDWVGPAGDVIGTDVSENMLSAARACVAEGGLRAVSIVQDDLFNSALPRGAFDLVHARFQLAPLGRFDEQLAAYRRWVKPGGWLVLEEPESSSWSVYPEYPSTRQLIDLIRRAFAASGANFDIGRELPGMLARVGLKPEIHAQVIALEPSHPYLRLPLQFAASLRPRLDALVGPGEVESLIAASTDELARPGVWGITFTLVQTWARVP